jgi:hypothetical protein
MWDSRGGGGGAAHTSVYDPVVVQIGDGAQRGADQIARVGFVIRALTAYPIEQLAAERKIGYQVHCTSPRLF